MHLIKAILLLAMMLMRLMKLAAQENEESAIVDVQVQSNQATFQALLRPLRPIAGAPEPFYTYFWEFGDGTFSFEDHPQHVYKDTGMYYARLFATNNYDDGKPPPARPRPVLVPSRSLAAADFTPSFFKQAGPLEMKVNRLPRPDEDLVLIMGYRNKKRLPVNGSLVLFYNEKQFRHDNFYLEEARAYHGEKASTLNSILAKAHSEDMIPNTFSPRNVHVTASTYQHQEDYYIRNFDELISFKQSMFRKNNTWRFEQLQPGEEKYFFISLRTDPAMIKDTNAVVVLNGLYIPDDPNEEIEEYALELPIVSSHDPNRMMLRNRRLNYRFTGTKKKMEYKVRFQNTGKGPAKQIAIHVNVPQMLNAHSLQIVDMYPTCVLCDSVTKNTSCLDTIIHADSIQFVFRNIYLPGIRQQGFSDPDSATGFIKYRLQFEKKLKKLPFQSNASIVFDNHAPVYTNGSTGYFKPGLSPAAIIGYTTPIGHLAKQNGCKDFWIFGASIAPYAPYKRYLQWEAYVSRENNAERLTSIRQAYDTLINGQQYFVRFSSLYEKNRLYKLHLVPFQIRYNWKDFAGAGAGTMISIDAYTKYAYRQFADVVRTGDSTLSGKQNSSTQKIKWFTDVDIAAFADIQLLKVRVGPAVGIRLLHYFREPLNHLMVYATWRL